MVIFALIIFNASYEEVSKQLNHVVYNCTNDSDIHRYSANKNRKEYDRTFIKLGRSDRLLIFSINDNENTL